MLTEKANEAPSRADWAARLEAALEIRRQSGPAAALPYFENLSREAPDRAAGWIETAACLRDLQQPERAETVLVDWLRKTPTDGRALHDLARLLEHRGAWADAEALWRHLLAPARSYLVGPRQSRDRSAEAGAAGRGRRGSIRGDGPAPGRGRFVLRSCPSGRGQ